MSILWRLVKKLAKFSFLICLIVVLLISVLLWYVTTDSFQRMARSRITAQLESATGGRVEVGRFHVTPLKFQVDVRDLTIHGREAPGQPPYVHVDSVLARVNLSAALGGNLSFHALT